MGFVVSFVVQYAHNTEMVQTWARSPRGEAHYMTERYESLSRVGKGGLETRAIQWLSVNRHWLAGWLAPLDHFSTFASCCFTFEKRKFLQLTVVSRRHDACLLRCRRLGFFPGTAEASGPALWTVFPVLLSVFPRICCLGLARL